MDVGSVTIEQVGSGQPFVFPIRLGTESLGYKIFPVPQSSMTFNAPVKRFSDQQSLNGTTMWRHVFQTKDWETWSFPVIVRNYAPYYDVLWFDALAADPSVTLSFWDHRANGVYTDGLINGIVYPLTVKLASETIEYQVREQDPFRYDTTLKLRRA